MNQRDLIDDDGENRAVRSFLAAYSCDRSITTQQMRQHLAMSGFEDCWPDWTVQDMHLTKGGAQNWLRHLFALELAAAAPVAVPEGMADAVHGQELLRWNRSQGDAAPIKIGKELAVARMARQLLR